MVRSVALTNELMIFVDVIFISIVCKCAFIGDTLLNLLSTVVHITLYEYLTEMSFFALVDFYSN